MAAITEVVHEFGTWAVARSDPTLRLSVAAVAGAAAGIAVWAWLIRMRRIWARDPARARTTTREGIGLVVATAAIFAGYTAAVSLFGAQNIPEQGNAAFLHWRMLLHLGLITLLAAATAIDLAEYVIPDEITVPGTLLALAAGAASGHVHLVPLWIDWSREIPLVGPYIPHWMGQHPHLHGIAASFGGLAVGAGLTWGLRWLSSLVLGREALGFGDVMLMALIGSVLGWQPTVFVLLLAPIAGLGFAAGLAMTGNRIAVPYGPFLSVATVGVLVSWKWLWTPVRLVFGHAPTLAMLGGGIAILLVVLLGGVRWWRTIPVAAGVRGAGPRNR